MKIVIFSIKSKNTNSKESECHVSIGQVNNGIEFNASRYGVDIVAYSDFEENIISDNYNGLPLMPVQDIDRNLYDYIIINGEKNKEVSEYLQKNNIDLSIVFSFATQKNECLSLFLDGKSICFRYHTLKHNSQVSSAKCFPVKGVVSENILMPKELESTHKNIISNIFVSYIDAQKKLSMADKDKRAGENWDTFLKNTRPNFYNAIKHNDIDSLEKLLKNFCRNEMSSGILGGYEGYNNFINDKHFIGNFRNIFNTWKNSHDDHDLKKVDSPKIGNPYGVSVENYIIHPNNFINHYRAVFTNNLLSQSTRNIVVEVGGGYGGYGHSLFQSDFEGTYINFDLPENLLVASYYLKCLYPDKKIMTYNDSITKIDKNIIDKYDIILMPHFMIETMDNNSADFCINTISFSEMDFNNITYYINNFTRISRKYIYHENMLDGGAGYNFFATSTFPPMKGFRKIFSTPSRWLWFSLSSSMHHHGEFLYEKINTH